MSHLQLPRIHFRGDFRANVSTCNNDDIASAFPDQQFVDSARVVVDTLGMDDGSFQTWLREIAPPFGIRAGWNLYGDCSCGPVNATAHGAHPLGADLIVDPASDPLINAAVEFFGVMVDLDPEGTLGTQIFCDELRLSKGNRRFVLGGPLRLCSRLIARRNLSVRGFTAFAAAWYAAIPAGRYTLSSDASPTLDSFRAAKAAGKELFLALTTYLLAPRVSQQQLAQDFAIGRTTQNPAIGKVLGTLGVADAAEMTSIPMGRRLQAAATLQHDHLPFRLNPAIASIDRTRRVISLDMSQSVPEVDETLAKVNVGRITLNAIRSGAGGTQNDVLGEIAYDRTAYELEAGIVDVAYQPQHDAAVDGGQFAVVQASTGAILLLETEWTAETDDRCIYLQEGETGSLNVTLQQRGKAPTAATHLALKQYVTSNRVFNVATSATAIVQVPDDTNVPSSGVATLALKGLRPGTGVIAFLPPGEDESSLEFFANIRVLPLDDYDRVPDNAIDFQFIYREVLRYYHLLYPVMSEKFDLSSEFSVRLNVQAIRDRIAKSLWNNSMYMPITRDLSDGKRKLLKRWCDLINP